MITVITRIMSTVQGFVLLAVLHIKKNSLIHNLNEFKTLQNELKFFVSDKRNDKAMQLYSQALGYYISIELNLFDPQGRWMNATLIL